MPDKDGDDDKKSTKSVVNKKQKQMMGEEGYDIARDEGRVRPSKDKKDATTLPVSDEVKKTQKVNKGPSALERVKSDIEKKYGKGAIMNVGKKKANEELDLTKIAESFGGYIVEIKITTDKSGTVTGVETTAAERAAAKKAQKKQQEIFKKAEANRIRKSTNRKPDKEVTSNPDTRAKQQAKRDIGPKFSSGSYSTDNVSVDPNLDPLKADLTSKRKVKDDGTVAKTIGGMKTYKIGDKQPEGKVAKAQRLKNRKPRVIPFKFKRTYSPEVQKKVDAVMKGIEMRKITNPDRRSRKRVSASGTPFKIPSKPKSTPLFFTNRPKGVGDTGTGLRKSLKQFKIDADSFDKKLLATRKQVDQLKKDYEQQQKQQQAQSGSSTKTKVKVKPIPQPEVEKLRPKNVKLVGGSKVTGDVEPDFVGPKRERSKTATKNRKLQRLRVAARSAKRPVQRLVKPTGSTLAKTAKFAGKNPFATLVGASMAKDTFFPVALPKTPTVQGGKVGRRTAG